MSPLRASSYFFGSHYLTRADSNIQILSTPYIALQFTSVVSYCLTTCGHARTYIFCHLFTLYTLLDMFYRSFHSKHTRPKWESEAFLPYHLTVGWSVWQLALWQLTAQARWPTSVASRCHDISPQIRISIAVPKYNMGSFGRTQASISLSLSTLEYSKYTYSTDRG